jgi:RNA polymerase sigma factor (sigma-70 family)
MVRDCGDPEDVVQQALADCYAALERYDPSQAQLNTWITEQVDRRASNAIRDYLNRQRLEAQPEGFDDTVEQAPDVKRAQRKLGLDKEKSEAAYMPDLDSGIDLKSALLALPAFQREVVLAVHVEGYSTYEYADKLGVDRGKVKRALATGLESMRDYLEREDG